MVEGSAPVVFTQDRSSGRIHRRYQGESGKLYAFEGCNLDDAGDFDVVDHADVLAADPSKLCKNDFPTLAVEDDDGAE